jgi:GT2 family glycosyltransferase/glycosyltransferase involved in cell wall biosynthesis
MDPAVPAPCHVSIIIPVLNKLEFTQQCLDRIWSNTDPGIGYEVVVVDNASVDGTAAWFADPTRFPRPVRYLRNESNLGFAKANNAGAQRSRGRYLLFLNNDTLVQPGWLSEMLAICQRDPGVGVVGIKQLFPYTNLIFHTGMVFTPERQPEHLYPHLDAALPKTNQQREYQAVNGACLLMERALFDACGGFDEEYRNGYEDVDLCLTVRKRGRRIVCCTRSFIFHYGQISEGRTAADDQNAALFQRKWHDGIVPDRDAYLARDAAERARSAPAGNAAVRHLPRDCIYLADALDQGSALTWINAELAVALKDLGVPVVVNGERALSKTLSRELGHRLSPLMLKGRPAGGIQVKWSHYWPQHLNLELAGDIDLELFVINYLFGRPNREPWDYWLQAVRQNGADKLPLSDFCRSVLLQIGVPENRCHVWHPGYAPEIAGQPPASRSGSRFRFLTVTNSHDLERYNTQAVLDAYREAFPRADDVTLVIKDYGASSGNTTLRRAIESHGRTPAIEYVTTFSSKRDLIALYQSCDAYLSAHRGEGYGMKILDALACGLPVVTPLFGGPTAYCRPDNCFPVDFRLVPVGACLDTQSLHITNHPQWAEVDPQSLRDQIRAVHADADTRGAVARRGHQTVVEDFSWPSAARRFVEIATALTDRSGVARAPAGTAPIRPPSEHSAYWLGVRISVVIPTHNRKDKLIASLEALSRQSILPQEFEAIVVDDGSTDGTREAVASRRFPFELHYLRQPQSGPGAARNLAIQAAAGEHVLFIGDDILADTRLLEEHLLAHAAQREPGLAVLGHIDWPDAMTPNQVMKYVCGEAMLQFAFPLIRQLSELDHRFFYTSNISLRRDFLVEAAAAGISFDPAFRHAAFEDSEFAMRLLPRGLRIRYVERARAWHDHWMDLDSFARRELKAGEMAVVFYRNHPGQDDQLLVRWIADLVAPAAALMTDADALGRIEAFDAQTDALLRASAESLETLLPADQTGDTPALRGVPAEQLRAALHNVLRTIFDVHRTRGKVQEWYAGVADPASMRAAQALATVRRKVEFFRLASTEGGPLQRTMGSFDDRIVADLASRLLPPAATASTPATLQSRAVRSLRRLLIRPAVTMPLLRADRYIQGRLQSREALLHRYRRLRSRIRRGLA